MEITKTQKKIEKVTNKTHFKARHKLFLCFVILTTVSFLCVNSVSAWWDTDYGNRKTIYIDGGNSMLSDFTVLINVSYDSNMQTDFDDLRFINGSCTSGGTTQIYHEFDKRVDSNSALVWIKIPQLQIGTNQICMYYGNSGVSNGEDKNNTWDRNYKGVYHLTEGSGTHIEDSKGGGNGTLSASGVTWNTTGFIGNSLLFDGAANTGTFLNISNNTNARFQHPDVTFEIFGSPNSDIGNYDSLLSSGDGTPGATDFYWSYATSGGVRYGNDIAGWNGNFSVQLGNISYFAMAYQSGNFVFRLNNDSNTSAQTQTLNANSGLYVGQGFGIGGSGYSWSGTLDEVRISNVQRNNDWMSRSYDNLFYQDRATFGSEELSGAAVINSVTYNSTTYEMFNEGFTVNVTYDNVVFTSISANLSYNGTTYVGTVKGTGSNILFSTNLDIGVDNTGNRSFNWTVYVSNATASGYTSSLNYNQTIEKILFELCNSTSTSRYLNISFLNEADSTRINATVTSSTWTYDLNDATLNKTYIFSNATQNWEYNFCFMPLDRTINVIPSFSYKQGTDYPQRTWNPGLKSYTNGTANQTLYLLGSTGNSVTFQVLNPSNQQLSGVSVVGTTSIGGVSTIIAQGTTDSSGSINFWLNPEVSHTFNFSRTGFTTQSLTLTPTEDSYSIVMGGSTAEQITDYSRGITLSIKPDTTFELNNDTTYNFNMTLSSSYWSVSDFGFTLSSQNGTQLGFVNSGSGSGTVSLNLDTVNYTRIVMDYYYTINSTNITLTTSWNVFNTGFTQWSISNFFTDLNTYLDTDMFGLDDFGRHLIVYLILFISIGAMSYKYGLTSPIAVVTMVFGIIYMFDVVIGLLPTPIEVIPNFFTFVAGLIMTVVIIRRVIT